MPISPELVASFRAGREKGTARVDRPPRGVGGSDRGEWVLFCPLPHVVKPCEGGSLVARAFLCDSEDSVQSSEVGEDVAGVSEVRPCSDSVKHDYLP